VDGIHRRAGRVPERVAGLPADGPQTEAEAVLGSGGEGVCHGILRCLDEFV